MHFRLRHLALLPLSLLTVCAASRPRRQEVAPPAPRIALSPTMLLSETAWGDPAPLVDEPSLPHSAQPKSAFAPGWTEWRYPVHVLVDLGRPYRLRQVSLYDGQGTGSITVSAGAPFQWKPLFADGLERYGAWNDHATDVVTRYVRVTITTPGVSLPEIALYGTPDGPVPVLPRPRTRYPTSPPTMDKFIGTNAFIDDPLGRMQAVGWIREYHSWEWDEGDGQGPYPGYPNNQVRFSPSAAAGGNAWFFDDYYGKLNRAGVSPFPVIQNNCGWLVGKDTSRSAKPVAPGRNPAEPASYREHADYLYQFAARYGARKVPSGTLKLAPNQPQVSGLGQVRYLEDWNEQDRDWEGRGAHFTPYEYAAMASADRDGHRGALGRTAGIKNADPDMKLVMGGIAGLNLDYVRAIKVWSDFHRAGDFPLDVINLHHYSNNGGEQGRGQVGISPEADHLREKLQPFVQWRNRNAPQAEIWVTEFGYDTHPASPQRAPRIGPYSQEEVQAQWIVRSYLALAAAGVDRAAQFMLRDVNPADATQFSTSGLVTEKGQWKPKSAWFYVSTLKSRLAGMRFDADVPTGNSKVRAYRFRGQGRTAYVVWCPTSEAAKVSGFRLPVRGAVRATRVTLEVGKANGNAVPLAVRAGTVTLAVSERPQMVLLPPGSAPQREQRIR